MNLRLREWLVINQGTCPVCGLPVRESDTIHHWLIRRMKGREELDDLPNILLCHASEHVPEAPKLGYKCAVMALEMFGPEFIEDWRDKLDFKVKMAFPEFYYEARYDLYGY